MADSEHIGFTTLLPGEASISFTVRCVLCGKFATVPSHTINHSIGVLAKAGWRVNMNALAFICPEHVLTIGTPTDGSSPRQQPGA